MKWYDNRKWDNSGDGRLHASLSEGQEELDYQNADGAQLYDDWEGDNDCLGSPILFFFRLGTSELTDASQLVNLEEIARVVKQYNLRVRVSGAADSTTGSDTINTRLGSERADFIVNALIDREIDASMIIKNNNGGINSYNLTEANRHCRVELLLPLQKQTD